MPVPSTHSEALAIDPAYRRWSAKRRAWLTAGLASAATIAVFSASWVSTPMADDTRDALPTVTVMHALIQTIDDKIQVAGFLVGRSNVRIESPVDGATVSEILATEGAFVQAGQVLARLSTSLLDQDLAENTAVAARNAARIENARAMVAEADATLQGATKAFGLYSDLKRFGTASMETYNERETDQRVSAAKLDAAKATLEEAKADQAIVSAQRAVIEDRIEKSTIKSPVQGIITRLQIARGERITITSPALFVIEEGAKQDLEAAVTETSLGKIHVGQPAEIVVADGRRLAGHVTVVAQGDDEQAHLGRVKIQIDGSVGSYGGFAKGSILTGSRKGIMVPISAILRHGNGTFVKVVKDGIVHNVQVQAAAEVQSGVQIDGAGLSSGDAIVARAGEFTQEGDRVRTVDAVSR